MAALLEHLELYYRLSGTKELPGLINRGRLIFMVIGPLWRGGARRRTRRHWMATSPALSTRNKTDIERAIGKRIEDMTDKELEAELKKRGISTLQH